MVLRIFDANLNRIGEGLRVIEEIARFLLDDSDLTRRLKTMRHELAESHGSQPNLLNARRSDEDVGAFVEVSQEAERQDLVAIVIANAKRVQESLRVLEEFSKLPAETSTLDWTRFKQARFDLYELERLLISRLLRRGKIEKLTGLYVIIDPEALGGRSEAQFATKAIRGGARVIQLRDKHRARAKILTVAQELARVCAESETLFIVNDYPDVAVAADADGVHIGQGDLPISAVRRILPIDKIIGCSTATLDEALQAQANGADYIAVGSIYPTLSKADIRLARLKTLRQVKDAVSVPVVAIGGINEQNTADVVAAGADCIAVISTIAGAENVELATRQLVAKLEG